MAKENMVMLHGQVYIPPRLDIQDSGTKDKAMIVIKILRRPMSQGQVIANRLFIDFPMIVTKNPENIEIMHSLRLGDMVDIKGVVTTREVNKQTICPQCRTKNIQEGNSTYITPIYICRREQQLSEEEGFVLLKKRSEVSNFVLLMGALCRDPIRYTDESGREYAQYQMAVNRKYRIKEDPDYLKTDYPWVKTFGAQALKDTEGLHTGSWVYINGALQTRNIVRHTYCDKCGMEYTWEEGVMEIVPYSTEYLLHCDFPESLENHGDDYTLPRITEE